MLARNTLEVVRYLVEAARAAPSADNSQPFQFVWDGSTLTVMFSPERGGSGIFGPYDHATLIALGALLENMRQAALAIDLPLRWDWQDRGSGVYCSTAVPDGALLAEDVGVLPLFARHTNRFAYKSMRIPDEVLRRLPEDAEADIHLVSSVAPETRRCLVQLARVSAESRFCSEDLHRWLIKSLRFHRNLEPSPDGLDISTLNLPPGGELFMKAIGDWGRMRLFNRFGLYKVLAAVEVQLLAKAPLLVSVVGRRDFSGTVAAGQLLGRAWTYLNSVGLAVHPYYVITDQVERLQKNLVPMAQVAGISQMKQSLTKALDLADGEILHMLLRVGYPERAAPRSGRLPLSRLLSIHS